AKIAGAGEPGRKENARQRRARAFLPDSPASVFLLFRDPDHVRNLGCDAGDADAAERAAAEAVQIERDAAGFEIELRGPAAFQILRAAKIERPAQQQAREAAGRVRRLGERDDEAVVPVGAEHGEADALFTPRPGHALPAIDQTDVLDLRLETAELVVLVAHLVPELERLRRGAAPRIEREDRAI